jgi:hypothetical protein
LAFSRSITIAFLLNSRGTAALAGFLAVGFLVAAFCAPFELLAGPFFLVAEAGFGATCAPGSATAAAVGVLVVSVVLFIVVVPFLRDPRTTIHHSWANERQTEFEIQERRADRGSIANLKCTGSTYPMGVRSSVIAPGDGRSTWQNRCTV